MFGPGIDEPLAMKNFGGVLYYAVDGLGSVTGLLAADGTVINDYVYDAFGLRRSPESVSQPFRYTGREFGDGNPADPSFLYYYRNRYYNPALGRFISEDRIGFVGGINLYAYVGNNPANYTDPLGLARILICLKQHTITLTDDSGTVQLQGKR